MKIKDLFRELDEYKRIEIAFEKKYPGLQVLDRNSPGFLLARRINNDLDGHMWVPYWFMKMILNGAEDKESLGNGE